VFVAVVVNGIFRLSQAANKAVPLKNDQVVKFGNYLISRKTVNTPRGVWLFASALDIVANNKVRQGRNGGGKQD
jgi:oligosaccharyltransferase complex subunit delta (ribophorin II)